MQEETVEVVIFPDGHVEIEVKGVNGTKCTQITKPLEEALGGVRNAERTLKPEYHSNVQEQKKTQDLK